MINVLPAYPSMFRGMTVQPAQRQIWPEMNETDVAASIKAGYAFAACKGTAVLAIGGIARIDADRGIIWGVLADGIGADFPAMHAAVKRAIKSAPFVRIEAHILAEHEQGHRWIKTLGFEPEGLMRKFWRGKDFMLYSKVV